MMYFGNLTEVLKLRLTPAEMDYIIKKAESVKMTVSSFMRTCIDISMLKDAGVQFNYGDSETHKYDIL